ncbi:MAG: hypothetical protein J6J16_02880 [Lachnospiraceae bacterium]|nr:hypothetical protein [Lachnospiraceae bacterium]
MKKLFLYLSVILIFAAVFFIAYFVSKSYFQDNSYKVVIETTEELTTREAVDAMDYVYNQGDYIIDNMVSYASMMVVAPEDIMKYNLKIVNGYIVVYNNLSNQVYEYTDIDADIIKELDYELYQKIEEMEFNTKEELFVFLESIDS